MILLRFSVFNCAGLNEGGIKTLLDWLSSLSPKIKAEPCEDILLKAIEISKEDEKMEELPLHIAKRLARSRVNSIYEKACEDSKPVPAVVDYEQRMLKMRNRPFGVIYDASLLAELFSDLIGLIYKEECDGEIVITNQLIATFEPDEKRYHLRVSLYSSPSIISTTGLVEAPAKSRKYYISRRLGLDVYASKEFFDPKALQHGDGRIIEALKGYLAQAVFYFATGIPFCSDPACRLFNAHWQHELLRAQLRPGAGFCQKHKRMLENFEEL